jgi:hypothetical protein
MRRCNKFGLFNTNQSLRALPPYSESKTRHEKSLGAAFEIQKASSVVFPYGRKHKKSNGVKSGLYRGIVETCTNSPRSREIQLSTNQVDSMTFQAVPLFDQRLLTRTNHYGHFLHILKAKSNTRNHLELLLKIQKASSVVFPYGRKHKKSNGAKSGLY